MSAPTTPPPTAGSTLAAPHLQLIALDAITPSNNNPRQRFEPTALDELANDIRFHGVLQPILVRPMGRPTDSPHFEIVAGERRWRAAKLAELTQIPCFVRDMDDLEAIHVAISENVQRCDLDPIEEARGYQLALDHGATRASIAELHQLDPSHVSRMLGLLRLPQGVQERIGAGLLSPSHGAALAPLIDHPEAIARLAEEAIAQGLTEKALRERVRTTKETLDEAAQPRLFRVPPAKAQEERAPTPAASTPAPRDTNGLTRAESDRQFREAQAPDPDATTPVQEAKAARQAAGAAPSTPAPAPSPAAERDGPRLATTIDASDDDWLFECGLSLDQALDLARQAHAFLTPDAIRLLKALTDAFNAKYPEAPQSPAERLFAILGTRAADAGLDINTILSNPE